MIIGDSSSGRRFPIFPETAISLKFPAKSKASAENE